MSNDLEQLAALEQKSAADTLAELEQDIVENRPDTKADDGIPEKFKGKTKAEIAKAYTELESFSGRRNSEYGELKRMNDELLQLRAEKPVDIEPVAVDDLLDDPSKTINSVVDKSERLARIERKLQQDELGRQRIVFEGKHPDWQETMNNPDFASWVNATPTRKKMYEAADKQYNYEVGDELFTLWEDLRKVNAQDAQQQRTDRIQGDLRAAATETGLGTTRGKKVYNRADLINLRIHQPEKYEAMEPEIRKAYEEGRVK